MRGIDLIKRFHPHRSLSLYKNKKKVSDILQNNLQFKNIYNDIIYIDRDIVC